MLDRMGKNDAMDSLDKPQKNAIFKQSLRRYYAVKDALIFQGHFFRPWRK
jgi:hypothetical protein